MFPTSILQGTYNIADEVPGATPIYSEYPYSYGLTGVFDYGERKWRITDIYGNTHDMWINKMGANPSYVYSTSLVSYEVPTFLEGDPLPSGWGILPYAQATNHYWGRGFNNNLTLSDRADTLSDLQTETNTYTAITPLEVGTNYQSTSGGVDYMAVGSGVYIRRESAYGYWTGFDHYQESPGTFYVPDGVYGHLIYLGQKYYMEIQGSRLVSSGTFAYPYVPEGNVITADGSTGATIYTSSYNTQSSVNVIFTSNNTGPSESKRLATANDGTIVSPYTAFWSGALEVGTQINGNNGGVIGPIGSVFPGWPGNGNKISIAMKYDGSTDSSLTVTNDFIWIEMNTSSIVTGLFDNAELVANTLKDVSSPFRDATPNDIYGTFIMDGSGGRSTSAEALAIPINSTYGSDFGMDGPNTFPQKFDRPYRAVFPHRSAASSSIGWYGFIRSASATACEYAVQMSLNTVPSNNSFIITEIRDASNNIVTSIPDL